jgi:site-specific DNA recombinase
MTVAVYVRVSTQRQAQAQTIEQQLERLRAHLRSQGMVLTSERIFRDDGCSGATLNRPGLDRLRDAVRAGEVTQVLVTDPDRLARNYVKLMVLLEELERAGCEVVFLDRPMGRDPQDQLLLQIRGAVAEYERTLIAERMRRGRQAKLRAGCLLPWSRAPYGYRLDPDHPRDPAGVTVEPAEAAVVQELFAGYVEDHQSLFGLARHLKALDIASPSGRLHWSTATLRGILTNPAYTGQVYAGRWRARAPRIRRSATHPIGKPSDSSTLVSAAQWLPVASVPPLVSEEQFAQVQAKLAQNRAFARRHNTTHAYLLRALVSCGVCGSSCLCRTLQAAYAYYICRGKGDPPPSRRDEPCRARHAPARQLDALVWRDMCDLLTHPEQIAQALARAHGGGWLPQELQARREQLRQGQLGLERQLERLTEAYLLAVIPLAEYQRRRQVLEQRLQAMVLQADQLEAKVDRQAELAGWAASATDFCARVRAGLASADFTRKRQLVELLIDRVLVTDSEVEIRYVVPLSPGSEKVRFCHLRKDYFDDPHALVAERDVGHRERVVVGGQHELAVQLLGPADLVPAEIGTAVVVLAEIGAEALGGREPAGGLGVVPVQARQLGLEDLEDLGSVPALPVRLLLVQAQNVAPAALALAKHHLLGAQGGRDVGITARVGQNLLPDLFYPSDRRGQDVAARTLAQLLEVGPRIQPGIADEQDTAKPHGTQVVLDRLHRGDVGRVAGKYPGAHRHTVAGDGQGDHHLRVVVPAFLAVPAFAQRLEGEPAPFMAGDVLLVARKPSRGAIVEDQIDVELEQIDRPPEHCLLDGVAMLGQEIHGAVELVEAEPARLGQPYPREPALVAGELGARPVEALRHHGQECGRMGRLQPLRLDLRQDRLADAEPGPQGLHHVHDAELEAGLDRDAAGACRVVGIRPAARVPQDPADARHQALQGGAVELVLATEAVDHAGLDMALLRMTSVLGQGEVAHHRAVLVPSLRGPEIHAHMIGVQVTRGKHPMGNRVPTCF